ncbi:MAG: bifunctional adenosylcobinamide kinase/adenosylcobinamide-phosphate guanylyltransferase [Lachnospiraceae bacterium]|nr:bifunctional adenosylcobinamide kinase/adenosylcobinamide-phosphate guanylyltransferase [Lachnospiraceae bacterium]
MKLIIGGLAQGKLHYVLQKEENEQCIIFDGVLPEEGQIQEARKEAGSEEKTLIINHFHHVVKRELAENRTPEELEVDVMEFVEKHPEVILICDEIGNGIVPVDAFERFYREQTGRILIRLAQKADEVVRVLCGIGQRIK